MSKYNREILEDGFNSFKEERKNCKENILASYYLRQVANSMGDSVPLQIWTPACELLGKRPICDIILLRKNLRLTLSDDGSIYKTKIKRSEDGGKTWNGDDVCYPTVKTEYVSVEKVASLNEKVFFENNEEVTFDYIELCAEKLIETSQKI